MRQPTLFFATSLFLSWLHNRHLARCPMANRLHLVQGAGNYQSFQYQLICCTLANNAAACDIVGLCDAAMTNFYIIPDPFALYDPATGVRFPGAQDIESGTSLCMCWRPSQGLRRGRL